MKERMLQKMRDSRFEPDKRQAVSSGMYRIYALAVTLGILAVSIAALLNLGFNSYILLLIPAVLASAWTGGWKAGALTTIVMTLGATFLFGFSHALFSLSPLVSYLLVSFAFFEGLLLSYIIDASHQSDELTELRQREQQLSHRVQELEEKYAKAEIEIRARDEFLSIASHELKTPLTSMLMQLQTALHNIRNVSLANFSVDKLMKMLDSAEHQSKRLSKMINDLLNISLITTGKLSLETEKFDLVPLVKEVVSQFADRAEHNGYHISLDTEEAIPVIWDKLRIEQVLSNLISNAMKYGNNKPIDVSVKKHGNKVKIEVSDEGIGIPPEKMEKIFGRFERAVTSQQYQGLGVGLYITHQIVAAHGGTIKVESTVNKGTTFILDIPDQKVAEVHLLAAGSQ